MRSFSATRQVVLYRNFADCYESGRWISDVPRNAYVVKRDIDDDLAMLKVANDDHDHTEAMLTSTPLHAGETMHILGHPDGEIFSYKQARVLGLHAYEFNTHKLETIIELNQRVDGGTSGGGLWNSKGELVGLCLARSTTKEISYFASFMTLRRFMAAVN